MSILKAKTVYIGNQTLEYCLTCRDRRYGIEIKVQNDSNRCFSARDVARDPETAESLFELFWKNLVFPENASEIFDDMLADGVL